MRYYEDENCQKYKGSLSLNDVSRIQKGQPLQEHKYIIYLTTPSRIWCLCALSTHSQMEWIERLNDGKQVINLDEKASIFVNIDQRRCSGNIEDGGCIPMERIKFMMKLYAKWMRTQQIQQQKAALLRKYSNSKSNTNHKSSKSNRSPHGSTTSIRQISRSQRTDTAESVPSMDSPHYRLAAPSMVTSQSSLSIPNGHSSLSQRTSMSDRKGINDILNRDLKEYNNVQLLNDYHHLLERHHHEKQFEAMHQYLRSFDSQTDSNTNSVTNSTTNSNSTKMSSAISPISSPKNGNGINGIDQKPNSIPLSVLRTFRDRAVYSKSDPEMLSDRESLYFGFDDSSQSEEIAAQMTLDAIYTHLYWSYNLCRLTRSEIKELEREHTIHENAIHGHHGTIHMEQNVISQTKRILMDKRARLEGISSVQSAKLDLRMNRFITVPQKPIPALDLSLLSLPVLFIESLHIL